MSSTVLVKVYPGTDRPNMFEVVDSDNQDRIDRLIEGYQYSTVEIGKPDSYTQGDAWDEYTVNDADGFTQWK